MTEYLMALVVILVSSQIMSRPVRHDKAIVLNGEQSRIDSLASSGRALLRRRAAKTPLAFTENRGQYENQILFKAEASGNAIWLTRKAVYYEFAGLAKQPARRSRARALHAEGEFNTDSRGYEKTGRSLVKASLIGADANAVVVGERLLPGKSNFLLGANPRKWRTGVSNYAVVRYASIYPGIDLECYGTPDRFERDFVVSPGADASVIKIHYEGAESLSINSEGDLVVKTPLGQLTEHRPVVFQTVEGERKTIGSSYVLRGRDTVAFRLDEAPNPLFALVIDPVGTYSALLGGSGVDFCTGVALDGLDNIYLVGNTNSGDFSTADPLQGLSAGGLDVVVVKFAPSGDTILYSTYVGGSGYDYGTGVAVDKWGSAYITGETYSSDFPLTDVLPGSSSAQSSVFVCKLSQAGNELIYSASLGGSGCEKSNAVAVDSVGNAYVVGSTGSGDLPIVNPLQSVRGGAEDAFVVKLNSSGAELIYGTYLGGISDDEATSVSIDNQGMAYVVGRTSSRDFPTYRAWQGILQGDDDIFMCKLNIDGNAFIFSSFVGGSREDEATGIALSPDGEFWISGFTSSVDFPCKDGFQNHNACDTWDGVVTRFSNDGDRLLYGSYLGGGDVDYANDIAVSSDNSAVVTGVTSSQDFPQAYSHIARFRGGGSDAFVVQISGSATGENSLLSSAFFGGSGEDGGMAIVTDNSGGAVVSGYSGSADFLDNSYYGSFHGGWDLFLTRLTATICGDVDGNGTINIADNVYLFFYVFGNGPPPVAGEAADVDCNGKVNVSDVVYLGNYVFGNGPRPCPDCK